MPSNPEGRLIAEQGAKSRAYFHRDERAAMKIGQRKERSESRREHEVRTLSSTPEGRLIAEQGAKSRAYFHRDGGAAMKIGQRKERSESRREHEV